MLDSAEWTISSATDERYAQARPAGEVHLLTRPTGGGIDQFQELFWTRVHDIVLQLPEPLSSGHSYTIELLSDPSATGGSEPRSIRFSFDDRSTVSPSLRLNQLGYAPGDRPKVAYLDRWIGEIGSMVKEASST